jgi:hypothetical protein
VSSKALISLFDCALVLSALSNSSCKRCVVLAPSEMRESVPLSVSTHPVKDSCMLGVGTYLHGQDLRWNLLTLLSHVYEAAQEIGLDPGLPRAAKTGQ